MSAAFTVTLPGPDVAASVTWDDVRAYMKAHGWRERGFALDAANGGDGEVNMRGTITALAAEACVSPDEMLTRIAGCHDRAELRARLVAELRAAGDEVGATWCANMVDVREVVKSPAIIARARKLLSAQLLTDLRIADGEVSRG